MSQPTSRDNREAEATTHGVSLTPPSVTPLPDTPTASAVMSPLGTPPRRRSRWLIMLTVLGPGVIAAAAGNDAGGVATYSQAGAQYGLSLLWSIAVVTVGLIVVQEMCSRMGTVTGKGLAALIRENFGVKVTLFAMIVPMIANFATTVSEFAGIAAVGEMFHVERRITVPLAMILVWLLVSRGSYQKVERILLAASLIFLTYVITALRIGVPWGQALSATFTPSLKTTHWDLPLIAMMSQLIGTTIAPYMQFYQQSAVRDKGVKIQDYRLTKWDTIVGCVLSNIVAGFIIIVCGQALYNHGTRNITDAGQAALALKPLFGSYAQLLFAFGLLNASLMAAVIVPLSTAYAVTESLGWESGLGRRIRELPLFYGTYGVLIVLSGLLIILLPPTSNLIQIIGNVQNINCALLPIELVLMLLLINRRRVMGKYRNSVADNIIAWITTVIAAGLSLTYLAITFWQKLHPG